MCTTQMKCLLLFSLKVSRWVSEQNDQVAGFHQHTFKADHVLMKLDRHRKAIPGSSLEEGGFTPATASNIER